MRFLIADDHPMYLEALTLQVRKAFPGAEIATAGTMEDARAAIVGHPDLSLVLLDFRMPGMRGVESVAALAEAAAGRPVAVMSGVAEPADVAGCINAGARGFLPKTLEGSVFASALGTILAGGTYLPTEYLATGPQNSGKRAPGVKKSDFTPREYEVLVRLARGASNKEIARELGLQEVTVKLHLTRIFAKMGVRNRSQAAVMAVSCALVN
jgi:two-component system nitrate/nitrite response regulator NarL